MVLQEIETPPRVGISLEDQIKLIFKLNGDLFFSQKTLKATYAHLQATNPAIFSANWDGLFFSLWSSEIENALSNLYEADELYMGLWTRKGEPIHHVYLLNKKGRARFKFDLEDYGLTSNEIMDIQSSVLCWNALDAKLGLHWMFLLELFSRAEASKNPDINLIDQKESPFPALSKSIHCRLSGLTKRLYEEGCKGPLDVSKTNTLINKATSGDGMYVYFLFPIAEADRKEFFKLLRWHHRPKLGTNLMEEISSKDDDNYKITFRIRGEAVADYYSYLRLKGDSDNHNKVIDQEICRVQKAAKYSDLLKSTRYTFGKRIHLNERMIDSARFWEWQTNQKLSIDNFLADRPIVGEMALEKARNYLAVIRDYSDVAFWRYDSIIRAIKRLASYTKNAPISIRFEEEKLNKKILRFPSGFTSLMYIEPDPEFYNLVRKNEPHDGFDFGIYAHLQHLMQPEDIAFLVYNKKGPLLQKRKFAIVG